MILVMTDETIKLNHDFLMVFLSNEAISRIGRKTDIFTCYLYATIQRQSRDTMTTLSDDPIVLIPTQSLQSRTQKQGSNP